ncbi:MAG: 50S ribosomal protein L21 [Patescibacteria group bacterium]
MAFAVIKTGGKQYLVEEGRYLEIEKIPGLGEGDKVTFDHVLLTDDGKETEVGTPTTGGKVTGKVLEAGRDDKKIVIKYKAKSRYFKKRGHRQPYLKVLIEKI